MKKLLFFVVSSVIVFGVTLFFRLGGHKKVEVQFFDSPEIKVLYKEHRGPYHLINSTITEVEVWAAANHVSCSRTFGLYLEDPRQVDERHLRSEGGCILDATAEAPAGTPEDFKFKVLPPAKYVRAQFDGAPSIGPMKVYPQAEEFMSKNGLKSGSPTLEIYSITGEREALTEYLFFLPETQN